MTDLKPGWKKVKFGDVVRLNKETCKDPEAAGINRVIGLEHLEPGDLRVRSWADVADGTTFSNRVRPGQVLFGKRRAYQRKVAVADFDAICSGDIYVFESADPKRLLPDLLPFICQTDAFFEHAVGTSAGSLSPRTNWKSLADYKFALPLLDEQRQITRALLEASRLVDFWHRALSTSRALHRSYVDSTLAAGAGHRRFVKGTMKLLPGWRYMAIEHLCSEIVDCLHRTPQYCDEGYPAIRTSDIEHGVLRWQGAYRVSRDEYLLQTSRLLPRAGDILFSREGGRMGMAALVPEGASLCISQRMMHLRAQAGFPSNMVSEYLNSSWVQTQIAMLTSGSASPHVNVRDVRSLMVPVPPKGMLEMIAERCKELMNLIAYTEKMHLGSMRFLCKSVNQLTCGALA
jgi:type I restriction enzyme S subunit